MFASLAMYIEMSAFWQGTKTVALLTKYYQEVYKYIHSYIYYKSGYMYLLPINTQVHVFVAIIVYCYVSSIPVFLHLLSDASWYLMIIILSVITTLHITLAQNLEKKMLQNDKTHVSQS